mmetsp:Transcript_83855/g.166403  ORF Transcript_83855/g.166403 Transcript_83855/m.166403 type:complete len:1056 (+) Transcript_83855:84-3251(+)
MAAKPIFVPLVTPSPVVSTPVKVVPFKPVMASHAKPQAIKPLWQPPRPGNPCVRAAKQQPAANPVFVPLATPRPHANPLFVSAANPPAKLATAFLRNLAYDVTENDLQELFEPFKASHVRIIRDKDTSMSKGYAFCDFPDEAALQAAVSGLQGAAVRGRPLQICIADEGQKGESVVKAPPVWRPTAPLPDIPQSFIADLLSQIKSCSGTLSQECRFGRNCKQVNCLETHSHGREIENAPSSLICWFRRKCKQAECCFVHPSGREIDEDSSKGFCSLGAACDNPDCTYVHPDTRMIVSKARCGAPGFHDNTKHGGPMQEGAKVQVTEIPEDWINEGREALVMQIQIALEGCGHSLACPPDVAADCKSAVATFSESGHASQAVEACSDMPFRTELHVSKPEQHSRLADRNEECCVFVGNIAGSVTHEELLEYFSKVGIVDSFHLVKDKTTQEHKGFGFCYFFDVMTAEAAVLTLDGEDLQGKRLRVSPFKKETGEVTTSCIQVWGYPKEWSDWMPGEILAELGIDLEVVDKLEVPPSVEEGGSRMIAKYKDFDTAKQTVEALSGSFFQIALYFAPQKKKTWVPEGGGTGNKESTIFVGNLNFETTEEDLQKAFSFNDTLVSARLVRDKTTNELKGYGFIEFTDAAAAQDALRKMKDCEINGRKIRLARAEEPLGQARNRSRSRRRRELDGDEKEQVICIHVDELALPSRPRVHPCLDDCEIWVDPLPDDEDTDEWLNTFGEVAEVFRVPNNEAGSPSDRGYVRFADHASAVKAVEAQVAQWSESERIIASQQANKRGNTCTYPFSVVGFIIGPGGKNLHSIRDDIGASMLVLRGEGLNPAQSQQHKVDSSRVHFLCKGPPDALLRVHSALEAALASIHNDIAERLEEPNRPRTREGSRSRSRQPCSSRPGRQPPSPPPPPIRQPHPLLPTTPPLPSARWWRPPPPFGLPLPPAFAFPSRAAHIKPKPSLAATRRPSNRSATIQSKTGPWKPSNEEWEDEHGEKREKRVASYPRLHAGVRKHASDGTREEYERGRENKSGRQRRSDKRHNRRSSSRDW